MSFVKSKTEQLLSEAAGEIRILRRENELLKAKVNTFDGMMLLIQTIPRYNDTGMFPDLVFAIESHLMTTAKEREAQANRPDNDE